MIAFLKMLIPLLILLSIVYIVASLRGRARAKARLKEDWDEAGHSGDREDFVDDGLDAYSSSFRRRVLLAIYIVPLLLIGLMVYLANYS
ncbi:MAG: hypothetical protein AAGF79_00045 [Pseudomonadota bacterium]